MSVEITNVKLDKDSEEWAKKTEKEIRKLKETQCSKCYFFSRGPGDGSDIRGTCDYILIMGKMRGCNPFDCVEKGKFMPKQNKRRRKGIRIKGGGKYEKTI